MSQVTLENLKIFCDVARQKSFSRAATLNNVSQSTASQTVSHLEKRLRVPLIDRSKRPLSLTPEGEAYFESCKDLVSRYFEVESKIQSLHNHAASRVRVASIYSLVLRDMQFYARRLGEDRPGAKALFEYLHPDQVYESVLNAEADLGLISFPRQQRELEIIPWVAEPMALVCSPSHPFAQLPEIAHEQLNGADFVAFEPRLTIRREIDRFFRARKVEVNRVMSFDNIEAIKRGIETAAGVSILPAPSVRRELRDGTLCIVPMAEMDLTRPLAIILRRRRERSEAVKRFIEILIEETNGDEPHADTNGHRAGQAPAARSLAQNRAAANSEVKS